MSSTAAVQTSNSTLKPIAKIWNPTKFLKAPSSLSFVANTSKTLSLRTQNMFKASAMGGTTYKVKLITPEGEEHEFEAPNDCYILESAEDAGVELPYSCRARSCSTCTRKMESGSVDQSDGSFLDDTQMKEGSLLTCVSYPTQDCVIYTHKETTRVRVGGNER